MDIFEDGEELIIRRPPVFSRTSPEGEIARPVTPPMDESLRQSKALELMSAQSPPYRKIRSMKIIESPKSFLKSRFDQPFTSTPTLSPHGHRILPFRSRLGHTSQSDVKERLSLSCSFSSPTAFVNPFTPKGRSLSFSERTKSSKKRPSHKSFTFDSDDNLDDGCSDLEQSQDIKRPRLSDFNMPRYHDEFLEIKEIGSGVHGCVYKCINRLNGVEYAVKRGKKPIQNERVAHNEIYAHGVLEHPNIVRNYSSWMENEYVYMQNEYCNGGSLEDAIKTGNMDEKQLRKILEHIAQGLRYIHSKQLAHMDIKPGNILITKGPKIVYKSSFDTDDFCDDDDAIEETVYKIGDLGHVTNLNEVVDVEEGDCRYLPKEILNDDYSNLTKVDIFALGLTLYEAAGGGPLPKNGEEWHNIREGKIEHFPHLSNEFNNLIKRMIHPNPDMRPSASELLYQTLFSPIYKTVKDKHELKAAKQKIQLLEQQLQDVLKCVKVLRSQTDNKRQLTPLNNNKGERLVGKKSKRSHSNTTF
ncbi:wee1-like protein kinase isoform X1 [Rhodnius prolixus]|uniref:wee1-like protein kinase isoform X1 n=1 Tax=Rhodnius prolixus TaxID=13249 RepID=UPI003D18CE64